MLRFLDRRSDLDAAKIAGALSWEDRTGAIAHLYDAGRLSPEEPGLSKIVAGLQFDLFGLLSWRSDFVSFTGRGSERKKLLSWARQEGGPSVRSIVGPAGTGKTRLAAEVANVLRKEGWSAGFVSLDRPRLLNVGPAGALLIIDRAEEQLAPVRALLTSAVADLKTPQPIRVLLLSRDEIHKPLKDAGDCRPLVRLDGLDLDAAETLFLDAKEALKHWYRLRPAPEVGFRTWAEQYPGSNCRPLHVLAAIARGVFYKQPLKGTGICFINDVIHMQRHILNVEGQKARFAEDVTPRLAALAALRGGLDADAIRRLADPNLGLGLPRPEQALERIAKLHWWQDGRFIAPEGDLMAAGLLRTVFRDHLCEAGDWVGAALADAPAVQLGVLGRFLQEISVLYPYDDQFKGWLKEIIDGQVGSHGEFAY